MRQATTLFLQIVRKMPDSMIQNAIDASDADLRSRVFHGRLHFYTLLLGRLRGVRSLRHLVELWDGLPDLRSSLGMSAVARSTLADANQSRGHEFFRSLMAQVLAASHRAADRLPRKFKRLCYALDSTSLELCAELHEWARVSEGRSAIKVHALLRGGVALPEMTVIGDGAAHDLKVAKQMDLPSGAILLIDRAYVDAQFFATLNDRGTVFVTRLKRKMKYAVIKRRPVAKNANGVTSDQEITLTGAGAEVYGQRPLRRVRYRDPETGNVLVFLTNDLRLAARTVARLLGPLQERDLGPTLGGPVGLRLGLVDPSRLPPLLDSTSHLALRARSTTPCGRTPVLEAGTPCAKMISNYADVAVTNRTRMVGTDMSIHYLLG